MMNKPKRRKKDIEEIRSLEFKYEKIQEAYEHLHNIIIQDEPQGETIKFLADLRDIEYDILRNDGIFYIENRNEVEYVTSCDLDRQYYLGFSNKNIGYEGRFVLPVRNMKGELNAWVGYDCDTETPSKYLVGMLGVGQKKNLLFGIHDIEQAFEEDTIIVNEGFFERYRLKEIGLNNSVSLVGKVMSNWHKQFLNRFKNVILVPDGDKEGQDMIPQWTRGLTSNVCVIKLKLETREFNIMDEIIEKKIKDLDDKLRDNPENKKRFKQLYDEILVRFEKESNFTVDF